MKIKSFNFAGIEKVSALLTDCAPYVLPHHPYVYWILGEYFPSLCFTAHEDDSIVGFVCALYSTEKDCIFIWQLAVDGKHRQMGTAILLCQKIAEYARNNSIGSLQVTINAENTASLSFFSKLAKQYGTSLKKTTLAGLDYFECENSYEIKL